MAVPMVFLTVITPSFPLMMHSLSLLPSWEYVNKTSVLLLFLSGLVGCTGVQLFAQGLVAIAASALRFVQDL